MASVEEGGHGRVKFEQNKTKEGGQKRNFPQGIEHPPKTGVQYFAQKFLEMFDPMKGRMAGAGLWVASNL